ARIVLVHAVHHRIVYPTFVEGTGRRLPEGKGRHQPLKVGATTAITARRDHGVHAALEDANHLATGVAAVFIDGHGRPLPPTSPACSRSGYSANGGSAQSDAVNPRPRFPGA